MRHGLAGGLRAAGPAVLGIVGLVLLVTGRAGLGGMLLSGALAWYGASRVKQDQTKTPGQRSTVRTAALEMELDHDTGGLEGLVLAGRHESKTLGAMSLGAVAGTLRRACRRFRKPAAARDVS